VLDEVDEGLDRQLAQHPVGLDLEDRPETGGIRPGMVRGCVRVRGWLTCDVQPVETLSAYITHARSRVDPVITKEAGATLSKAYVELRQAGADPRTSEKRIAATTRQLETMIRIAEAHARMRLASFADAADVAEAVRLMCEALKTAAVDRHMCKLDMGLLNTGVPKSPRRALDAGLAGAGHDGVRWAGALKRLVHRSSVCVDPQAFAQIVHELEQEGAVCDIRAPTPGAYRERHWVRNEVIFRNVVDWVVA
jgi:DNA replication licensing factor MCM4